MRRIPASLVMLALPGVLGLGGCVEPKSDPEQMSDEDDDQSLTGSTSEFQPDEPDEPDQPMGTSTGGMESSSDGMGESFIVPPDDPPPSCDVWTQDCPAGEKCMPWANDGGFIWNDLKCVEIADDPGQPGDACMVEGSGVTGIDTCDIGSMCWDVDGETDMGTCVAMCAGDPSAPLCEDPDTSCVIVNEGVLTLCLPHCDPLLQDCVEGQACYPVDEDFICAPNASNPDEGLYGDPCEAINTCEPGLFCAIAEVVPGCAGSVGCCSEFCDLNAADPTDACSGAGQGQECLPWYTEGNVPPGGESLGACAIPTG